jgi:hypothetical protein
METFMKLRAVVLLLAAVAIAGAPVSALAKRHGKSKPGRVACEDRPYQFSWDFLWSTGNPPAPNGCAPAVYNGNRFIGQDPDPNVRLELRRNPLEGDFGMVH